MTNEDEKTTACKLREWRKYERVPTADLFSATLDLAERLLKENSELRVRDSNVTFHSKNVMGINEELQHKLALATMKGSAPRVVYLAYLKDRQAQYKPDSGSYHAFDLFIEQLMEGEHVKAWHAGELDDLIKDLERSEEA